LEELASAVGLNRAKGLGRASFFVVSTVRREALSIIDDAISIEYESGGGSRIVNDLLADKIMAQLVERGERTEELKELVFSVLESTKGPASSLTIADVMSASHKFVLRGLARAFQRCLIQLEPTYWKNPNMLIGGRVEMVQRSVRSSEPYSK
jgi:acid phosphatase family membrane protein YuiD